MNKYKFRANYQNFVVFYRHSSSSQAPMLYGTDGDSRAIGFPPTSPLHTRGATFSPYACFLPRSPFITGYRPRDERLLSSNNARKQAQCPVCYKTFSKFGSIKVCSKETIFKSYQTQAGPGADLNKGRVQRVRTPPPTPEMKPSSLVFAFKICLPYQSITQSIFAVLLYF